MPCRYLEQWEEVIAKGPSPPGLYNGSCSSVGHHLYVYGGTDGNQPKHSLYELNTTTSTWTQLGTSAGPMAKINCGMVSHGEDLVLFGGFGVPSAPTQPGAEFIESVKYAAWSNELHRFNLKEGEGACSCKLICQGMTVSEASH